MENYSVSFSVVAENGTLRSQKSVIAEIRELKSRLKFLGETCESDKTRIGVLSKAISTTNYLDKKERKSPYSTVTHFSLVKTYERGLESLATSLKYVVDKCEFLEDVHLNRESQERNRLIELARQQQLR